MSGVEWFDDAAAINPFMDASVSIDRERAKAEHKAIQTALENAGVKVVKVDAPKHCQDGVYTANWALVRGKKAVLASLPNARKAEEAYAEKVLTDLGVEVVHVPNGLRFSGQGDALPCGNYLFTGLGYRSDDAAQQFAADTLGFERIALQTVPKLSQDGSPYINPASGWPDSFFYDIDLALAILREPESARLDLSQNCDRSNLAHIQPRKGLVAWCPEAFTEEARATMRAFDDVEKLEVSLTEAKEAFACNLVSTGETIIMSAHAPLFTAELKRRGFTVITPEITELAKGGGYIRCTTLTLP